MRIVLTFDDGPGPSTGALLDALAARGVSATFFVLGASIDRRRAIAVRAAREGHALGNHTYSHDRTLADRELADGSTHSPEVSDKLVDELARTDALLDEVYVEAGRAPAGRYPVRLPYGVLPDDARVDVLHALGRVHVGWTADFADWLPTADAADLARRMRAHVDDRAAHGVDAVLDLHDGSRRDEPREATVAAVARLIDELGPAAFAIN